MTTNTTQTDAEIAASKAAETVAHWQTAAGKIETKLADARAAIAKLEATRRDNALAAATGDTSASAAVLEARRTHAATALEAEDLGAALVDARAKLNEALAVHGNALREVSLELARAVISKRIAAAANVDRACTQMTEALKEYQFLWAELASFNELYVPGGGMSAYELREGSNRIKACLPAIVKRMFDLHGEPGSLEASERAVWRGVAG